MAKARGFQAKSLEITAGTKPEPRAGTGRRGQWAILRGRQGQLGAEDGTKSAKEQMTEDSAAAQCSCSNSRLCFKGNTNVFRNERRGGTGKKCPFHS